jgi:hypothetical protein
MDFDTGTWNVWSLFRFGALKEHMRQILTNIVRIAAKRPDGQAK